MWPSTAQRANWTENAPPDLSRRRVGCELRACTKYALGLLGELRASDAEIDEAISVAMTVGASSARLLVKKGRAENS